MTTSSVTTTSISTGPADGAVNETEKYQIHSTHYLSQSGDRSSLQLTSIIVIIFVLSKDENIKVRRVWKGFSLLHTRE